MTRSAYIESLLEAALPPFFACVATPATASDQTTSVGDEFEALFGGRE